MAALLKYMRIYFCLLIFAASAQNQNSKWLFGNKAGLDFMSNPPAFFGGSVMNAFESGSSISDAAGNLLFYTDGITVWNSQHQVMPNGSGLLGSNSATDSGFIIKQPGNKKIYFIFTIDQNGNPNGLRYTIVDMALAAGMGSVTAKNVLIKAPSTEKLTAARHCNGNDIWLVSHDFPGNSFRSTLITASGVGTTAVLSPAGTNINGLWLPQGCMKMSPTGNKLCMALYPQATTQGGFELFDFDNSTGIVSNSFTVYTATDGYGCEFSADGTKLYGSTMQKVLQWDLCAGSNAAIIASQYTVTNSQVNARAQMKRAINNQIYISSSSQSSLDVISNPNGAAAACNFISNGLPTSTAVASLGLPKYLAEKIPLSPFSYNSVPCSAVSFTPPAAPTITATACTSVGYSVTNMAWDFGHPASGSLNQSTAANPSHVYPGPGNYTVQLIYYYSCGGGTDTLRQQVTVPFCPTTGILQSQQNIAVKIYPNPSSGQLIIESNGETRLFLYNKVGVLLLEKEMTEKTGQVDLQQLDNGIYLLRYWSHASGNMVSGQQKLLIVK